MHCASSAINIARWCCARLQLCSRVPAVTALVWYCHPGHTAFDASGNDSAERAGLAAQNALSDRLKAFLGGGEVQTVHCMLFALVLQAFDPRGLSSLNQ